jgi:hypothetical protein
MTYSCEPVGFKFTLLAYSAKFALDAVLSPCRVAA